MVAALTLAFVDGFDAYTSPHGTRKWTNGNGIFTTTSGTRFNAGRMWNSGSASHQLGTNFRSGMIAAPVRWAQTSGGTSFMEVLDSTGTPQLSLLFVAGNTIQIRRGSAIGTILATSTVPRSLGIWDYVEFGYYIDTGVAGAYRIAVNGVADIFSAGANTQATGLNTWAGFGGNSTIANLDDWLVKTGSAIYNNTDDFWGDRRVSTLFTNGVGDVTQWLQTPATGLNYDKLDELLSDDDATIVSSDVIGALDLYQFENLMAGATDIRGIQFNMIAKRENAGTPPTRQAQIQVRSNSVDSNSPSITLSSTYVGPRYLLLLDPSGGVQFTKARVDAIQAGPLLVT